MSLGTVLWISFSLLDVYALVRAVYRWRAVEGTLAWMLAIIAFPGVGAVAYLLLSVPSLRRTTQRKRLVVAELRTALPGQQSAANEDTRATERGHAPLLRLASALTGLGPTRGNTVELLAEDDRAFRRIEADIQAAKTSIWAEYYIIRNDETGHRFLDLLAAKAAQGLDVRLLYDAVGSLTIDSRRLRAIVRAGGKAEPFLPINPLRRRWSVHLRNHRKMIVVDGKVGFTGGMNIGDEYSGRARRKGEQHFRDSHLAMRGPVACDMAQTFAEDWSFATGELLELPAVAEPFQGGPSTVALVPSGPDQEHNANGMVYFAGIATAQRSAYLTSPYFVPDEPTMRALVQCRHAGGRRAPARPRTV